MITPELFQQALNVNKQIIECIFDQEDSFKKYLVNDLHFYIFKGESVSIERVHVSGHRFRVSLEFDDFEQYDAYIDAQDVYSWYEQEYKRLRGMQL